MELPAKYYWYGKKQHGPSCPSKWVEQLLSSQSPPEQCEEQQSEESDQLETSASESDCESEESDNESIKIEPVNIQNRSLICTGSNNKLIPHNVTHKVARVKLEQRGSDVTRMELRTFCMVSVYCCTGHRPLLSFISIRLIVLFLLYHSCILS